MTLPPVQLLPRGNLIFGISQFFQGVRRVIGEKNMTVWIDRERPTEMLSGFFLSLSIAVTLFAHIDISTQISTILGLIVGGLSATPIGIYLNRKLPHRALMGLIGALIIVLSLHTMVLVLSA